MEKRTDEGLVVGYFEEANKKPEKEEQKEAPVEKSTGKTYKKKQ